MNSIQVDMFEVQLGAGMLLQFRTDNNQMVRVLVDAGVDASRHDEDHVNKKLPYAFVAFEEGYADSIEHMRIDLMVGSHYDADHLLGLVPIINDPRVKITEAWLPPVADDTSDHAYEDDPSEAVMLASLFASENGLQHLRRYLSKKKSQIDHIKNLEGLAREVDGIWEIFDRAMKMSSDAMDGQSSLQGMSIDEIFSWAEREFSQEHGVDGHAHTHANEPIIGVMNIDEQIFKHRDFFYYRHGYLRNRKAAAINLAMIRKSTAKSAITATSLAKVVRALKEKRIPIRCRSIDDGMPQRFVWRKADGKFYPSKKLSSDGPVLSLLGPSKGLIKKHWDRLPIGDYALTSFLYRIPVRGITPSNQLSYVMRFEHNEQGILIAGDAGCVDFKPKPRGAEYYQDLLDVLKLPLHVVQVAHHGGNNAHFYHVLQAANYGQQEDSSYLLLSHATNDKHRPSEAFGQFIGNVRNDDDNISLLFTSRPNKDKVLDYLPLINPVVGGAPADEGDVRLVYENGWQVTAHAIKVV